MKKLLKRLDRWADTSRLNPWRLLVMPHPRLTEAETAAFDALLARTPEGGEVQYDLPQPKWWFLHHAVSRGLVLHGTNQTALPELRTRATGDAFGVPVEGLFASDDAIWPLYFATVRRAALKHGYINWAMHIRGASRYLFSIGADPRDPGSWSDGTIYLLPVASFRRTGETRELISAEPLRPRALLHVTPDDFPFRHATIEHGAGDLPRRVVVRHALRPPLPLAAAFAAAFLALAALVATGVLTRLDRWSVHHVMPWARLGSQHLVDVSAVLVPETRSTLGGTLVGLWTYPASPFVSGLIVLACAIVLERRGFRSSAFALCALWVAANVIEVAGKLALSRPSLGVRGFGHSYPSGHTVRSLVVATAIAWTWRRFGPAAFVWAAGVIVALVLLGDHTPSDVLGGALLAGVLLAAASPQRPR